ncbi:MAG: hypothetical protein ABIO69_08475 [Sphingomicrobium sp.]
MLRVLFYFSLLIGVAAYALWRGRRDERIAALTCVVASLASFVLLVAHTADYANLELGVAMIDFAALVAFTWIALKSSRFWPLWVAGLQLTSILGHALKFSDSSMLPVVYATSLASWSYAILLIIALGTWRGNRGRAAA